LEEIKGIVEEFGKIVNGSSNEMSRTRKKNNESFQELYCILEIANKCQYRIGNQDSLYH